MARSESWETILTNRELEVLKLMSKGNTDHEIAALLFVSPLTVKTHRRNILTKLHVKNCVEAIYKAAKLNWI